MDYRSEIARVNGLGSGRSGTYQHIIQRVTAVGLIPLSIWLVMAMIRLLQAPLDRAVDFISSPAHMVGMVLLCVWGMLHGMVGMKMVIEDYVSNINLRALLLLGLYFLCVVTVVTSIVATFTLHIFFVLRFPG